MSKFFKKRHSVKKITPTLSFIVAAFNEEKIIRLKIENDLLLEYPKDKIEIIIVSDGSSDLTPEIVNDFRQQGIIGLHKKEREGKTAALNRAVAIAKNEILVFSDANSMFEKNALKLLVRHFHDPKIGGVSGRKSILENQARKASGGDNLFWKYESLLKQAESDIGSIPTADGEIFAMRKNLYKKIDPNIINDDMALTLNILTEGFRVIYDSEALTFEEASITLKDDFNVKSRMVYGGWQIIFLYFNFLNPFLSFFGLQFFFHKTLRYLMWFLLPLLYFLTILNLGKNPFYLFFFFCQSLFYGASIIGFLLDGKKYNFRFFYLPYYFCNVNIAAAKGFIFFLKQKTTVDIWKKAQR